MTASTIADPRAVMTDRAARDADFAAYLQARQASVLRTAYLLSGDRHTAEDLTQTAFAKLYLAWDRVRDQGSIDGYLRRILVNENNSLWRRGWKKREHTAELLPEPTPVVDEYDDGATPPCGTWSSRCRKGARRPRAALLRAAVRGRDRRGPRHLRRHREVPDQPGPGHAPRAHAGPPRTPQSGEEER